VQQKGTHIDCGSTTYCSIVPKFSERLKCNNAFLGSIRPLKATHLDYTSIRITTDPGLFAIAKAYLLIQATYFTITTAIMSQTPPRDFQDHSSNRSGSPPSVRPSNTNSNCIPLPLPLSFPPSPPLSLSLSITAPTTVSQERAQS
jgi:hypothetical protein